MAEIDVPIIDIGRDFEAVVADVKDAALRCGFFVIRNHAVSEEVITKGWAAMREFFDLPQEVKDDPSFAMKDDYPYGYSGMGTEKAGNDKKAGAYDTSDLKEAFQVCLSSEAKPAAGLPTPRWPSQPAHFKGAYTAYYRAMEELSLRLLKIFAAALDLPPTFFDDKIDSHWGSLRSLNYPEQKVAPNPGQLRIAAHSDYGVLTILRADDAPGGLQVLKADGSWSDVVIPPDCFCINLGDLMQRWTNDLWRSTVHRVVNPPLDAGRSTRRQSCAYFCNLNKEATCEVITSCVTAERPARYPPINAFEHLMERHARATGAVKAFSGDEDKEKA